MRIAIICGALVALTVTTAGAQERSERYYSAGSILQNCKAFLAGRSENGFCPGIIMGLVFMAENFDVAVAALGGADQLPPQKQRCRRLDIPNLERTKPKELVQVVVPYMEAQPKRMHEPFAALALEALFDAWPCRN